MKRYKIEIGKSWLNIVHDEDGEWVKWEDHIKAMDQMAAECAETIDCIARIAEELDVKI